MSTDTPMPTSTEPEPAAPPRPWWRKRPAIITAAAVVVLGAAAGIWSATSSTTAPIQIHGSINLGGYDASQDTTDPNASISGSDLIKAGDDCEATSDYDDITQGTTVTIGGSNGQPIGVGPLSAGSETSGGYCQFTFDVTVPGGQSAYTVTVSHRGTTTFTPKQAQQPIVLTLGL